MPSRICKYIFALCCYILFLPLAGSTQCQDWQITANVITSSTCAANGSFEVTLSGPDAANLTNIQYGVPATGSYAVPLNNSPAFTGVPSGTWEVSAVALCGGNFVGKNTTVTMPGDYKLPVLYRLSAVRNSLNCMNTGRISVDIRDGRAPYTVSLTSVPAAYTGTRSFTATAASFVIPDLAPGSYMVQVVDACSNGTSLQSVSVGSLSPGALPVHHPGRISIHGCDTLLIPKPGVQTNNNGWAGYPEQLFTVSAIVSNGLSIQTGFELFTGNFVIPLAAGRTLKDYYGATIQYTVRPACGSTFQTSHTIPYPGVTHVINQNCNTDFRANISVSGLVCLPVTYTITAIGSGIGYGTHTANSVNFSTPALPLGNYQVQYTTADGYTFSSTFSASAITGVPYSVTVINGANGLHNYIEGFRFSSRLPSSSRKVIELFNGPAGYTHLGQWYNAPADYTIYGNQTPTAGKHLFVPGNYVWKITDDCGTYLLPVTVGPPDLFQFAAWADSVRRTCNGLMVWPGGSAMNNGQPVPVLFRILKDGSPFPYSGNNWTIYHPGQSVLLSTPGTYRIIPYNSRVPSYFTDPDGVSYFSSYTFDYTVHPVRADMDQSQGFICSGSGMGEIHVKGMEGFPVSASAPYRYYLARGGDGVAGPYIADNTTGVFTGFGANAGEVYDVKIVDSCGGFAVQPFEILDLARSRLISSSTYVACDSATVQLSALYLPGATYSWTGPNGFTSSLRNPRIEKIGPQQRGVYRVAVTTPQCSHPFTDTTVITSNIKPPEPLVSQACAPRSLTVINPTPGIVYTWLWRIDLGGGTILERADASDTAYTRYPQLPGRYQAIATDTLTRCISYSDSLIVGLSYDDTLRPTVYASHMDICPGDSVTLVANTYAYIPPFIQPGYQWFRNGTPVTGATQQVYVTDQPGQYKVSISVDSCIADTSAEISVSNISLPAATLQATDTNICAGDTAMLQAATGTGYTYTWVHNGNTIPGAHASSLHVSEAGYYYVAVANTGCAVISDTVRIHVHVPPVVQLTPAGPQTICLGDTVHFSTPPGVSWSYAWYYNTVRIPGANTNMYAAVLAGTYNVSVSAPNCPDAVAADVTVQVVAPPSAGIRVASRDICAGDTVRIYADTGPGYSYSWYRNGQVMSGYTTSSISPPQSGVYRVVVSNGVCARPSDTLPVTIHARPVAQISPSGPHWLCAGDTLYLDTPFDPGYRYTWYADGAELTGSSGSTLAVTTGGRYAVSVINTYCSSVSDSTAVVLLPAAVSVDGNDTLICSGIPFAIPLSATEGFDGYTWSDGTTTRDIVARTGGAWWVRAVNRCGSFTDTVQISTLDDFLPGLPADTLICNAANEAVLAVRGRMEQIIWSTGAQTPAITINTPGLYHVTGVTPCGLLHDTVHVRFCTARISDLRLSDNVLCAGECIDVSAGVENYPLRYEWTFPGGSPVSWDGPYPPVICYGQPGEYPLSLTVRNAGGADSLMVSVKVLPVPAGRFADTIITAPYKSLLLLPACGTAETTDWYLDDSLVCAGCPVLNLRPMHWQATYHCVLRNGSCTDTCSYEVRATDIPSDIIMPTAFSPNHDGKNDRFRIVTDNPNIRIRMLTVYNRWGNQVYAANDPNGWNGDHNGAPAPAGTYFWYIEYGLAGSSETWRLQGDVILVR